MRFSVVIPAYNEEKALGGVLDGLKKIAASNNYETEVIVVDDGSKDKTAEIARSKGIKVLQHEKTRGYGQALKTGIDASGEEIVVILDSDGSHSVDEMPILLKDIDKCEMVIGARTKKGVKMPFLRKLTRYILAKLAEYLTEREIPDINSGFRVFKKSMYKKYADLLPAGFSFTLTLTLISISKNEKIKFIPIGYNKGKSRSKIRPVYDTLNFFLLIIRTILYFNPLRVFFPMAVVFIFASLAAGFYSIVVMGKLLDVTVTLLFIFGIQLIFLGLIADLINRRAK